MSYYALGYMLVCLSQVGAIVALGIIPLLTYKSQREV